MEPSEAVGCKPDTRDGCLSIMGRRRRGQVAIPFVRHAVVLHNALLDGLGDISLFLLHNLVEGCALEALQRATGLTPLEIDPLVQRLVRLRLLDEDAVHLTPEGRMMGTLLKRGLHKARKSIWFDAVGDQRARLVMLEEAAFVARQDLQGLTLNCNRRPSWEQLHAHQQSVDRSKTLARLIRDHFWSDSDDLLEGLHGHQGLASHWLLSLEQEPGETDASLYWLPVRLPLHAPRPGTWLCPMDEPDATARRHQYLDIPIAEWSVIYASPNGWADAGPLPDAVRLATCALDNSPVGLTAPVHDQAQADTSTCRAPEHWRVDEEALVRGFESRTPTVGARWSRTTSMTARWLRARIDIDLMAGAVLQQHADVILDTPVSPAALNP